MSRTLLIAFGVIVTTMSLALVVWGRSSAPQPPVETPVMFAPPPRDLAIVRSEWFAKHECQDKALAYDPRTRTPDLTGCDLSGLGGWARPGYKGMYEDRDFTGANLSNADMAGTTFAGANFTDADFSGADLSPVMLSSNYTNANFTGASMTHAQLVGAHLNGANFTDTDLSGTYFYGFGIFGEVNFWATFDDVTWANTICPDGTNSDANGGTCADHLYVLPSHRPSPTPDGTSN